MTQGIFLAVQWLGLCVFTALGRGSSPGQGTKIPQVKKTPQYITILAFLQKQIKQCQFVFTLKYKIC